jgi:N-acyl-D-aspartate/D-glutamate deacylase
MPQQSLRTMPEGSSDSSPADFAGPPNWNGILALGTEGRGVADLVIKDAIVVDGTGAPGVRRSLAVTDGRISAVGDDESSSARQVIDASGLVLCPGFVDLHTHYDAQMFWDGACSPSLVHGVTTVIAGNCGMSLAPLNDGDENFLIGLLGKVEAIPHAALEGGVPFGWHTFDQMLSCLEGNVALNVGVLVGHSTVRRAVMGDRASESVATAPEIEQMRALLATSIEDGGLGFSSSTARAQLDGQGRPTPPKFADKEEFVALAEVCSTYKGTSLEFIPNTAMDGFNEADASLMIQMSIAGQRPLNWNSLTVAPGGWDIPRRQFDVTNHAESKGGRVVPLLVPHNARWRMDFSPGNHGLRLVPGCDWLFALTHRDLLAALSAPDIRGQIAKSMEAVTDGFALTIVRTIQDWTINDVAPASLHHLVGRRIGDLAAERSSTSLDMVLDLAIETNLDIGFRRMRYQSDEETWALRESLLRDPRVVLGASDAGAHVDSIANAEYPTASIKELVRERPVFRLEELIRLMTSVPADLYGLIGRGLVREGAIADLVLLDPETVGPDVLHFAYDFPGNTPHLISGSLGIERALVSGTEVVREGRLTGSLPGRILRSGRDTAGTKVSGQRSIS